MVQYEICFTNEYTQEIIEDLAREMHLPYSHDAILRAINERDMHSPQNVVFIGEKERFICVDCNDKDWIYPIVVRCTEKEAIKIKNILLQWDTAIRIEYNQQLQDDLENRLGKEYSWINHIESFYNISFT